MFDGRFRDQVDAWVRPVGRSAKRAGISADLITVIGLAMAVACAVAIGAGALRLGLLLMILTGIPDLLDGAVAKASGTASQRGAFFDSVSDRITDALLLGGIAWYFTTLDQPGALPVLAFVAMATGALPSYIRAKAEALGIDGKGGLVERAERFILLGLGLLFDRFLVPVLVILVVLNLATAAQRFVNVWRGASAPVRPARPAAARRRPRGTASPATERWLARREAARARPGARRAD